MKRQITTALILVGASLSSGAPISDPIADFLSLPIQDRYSDASEVVMVYRVSIDIDSDGSPETLIGHQKMWLGDKDGVYWAIYTKEGEHFKRLTKPDEDIRIQFYNGSPDFMYVGSVSEQGGAGILVVVPILQQSDEKAILAEVEHLLFIAIEDEHATARELPGLNLSVEADEALYQKYFANAGHQGGFQCEKITIKQLQDQGYQIPDWKVALQSPTRAATRVLPEGVPTSPGINTNVKTVTTGDGSTSWVSWLAMLLAAIGLLWALRRRFEKRF